jgi:hypothetical protein
LTGVSNPAIGDVDAGYLIAYLFGLRSVCVDCKVKL